MCVLTCLCGKSARAWGSISAVPNGTPQPLLCGRTLQASKYPSELVCSIPLLQELCRQGCQAATTSSLEPQQMSALGDSNRESKCNHSSCACWSRGGESTSTTPEGNLDCHRKLQSTTRGDLIPTVSRERGFHSL